MNNLLVNRVREKVSADRNRFNDGKYNLDLAYITPNIIAMGFPADGITAVYRNHIDQVSNMLRTYHEGLFMIWNLSDLKYDYTKFDDQIMEFGFPDHHNPPLDLLFKIVLSMDNWLKASPQHVAVVHCVGGKGRTGTVIACYLIYAGLFQQPLDALDFFAKKRSKKAKGVTQASQRRYVLYFHDILSQQLRPYPRTLVLNRIVMHTIPRFGRKNNGSRPLLNIWNTTSNPKKLLFATPPLENGEYQYHDANDGDLIWIIDDCVLRGDILIKCVHAGKKKVCRMFRCAFHTAFVEGYSLSFNLQDLDDIKTSKEKKAYDSEFAIHFIFSDPPDPEKYEDERDAQVSEMYMKVFQNMRKSKLSQKKSAPQYSFKPANKLKWALSPPEPGLQRASWAASERSSWRPEKRPNSSS
eukprot:TRINITY_DN7336_c0_g1_i1.p1 TRINITY_DN7336_c0_g1~~TRINITY_DN7336_c0_g1_i1.p1  ORF type:complete len:411 (+),score=84.99 TRINITY_DN7336_c0_g1_i1:184-1416(+)